MSSRYACLGKEAIGSETAAKYRLELMTKKIKSNNTLVYYKCPGCKKFHIGNVKNKKITT